MQMGITANLVIFTLLLAVLSFLRQKLVYELAGTSLLLFRTSKPGIYLYSILVLPGTIIHELSHWLMAELLQVRTGQITILPELRTDSRDERLGSVATAKTDPFRGFLIGIAPFLTGMGLLIVLGQLLSNLWMAGTIWWQIALICYGIMVLGNSMLLSRADRHTWPFIILLLLTIIFLRYYLSLPLPIWFSTSLESVFSVLNQVLGLTVAFNLAMIAGSIVLRRSVENITRRRLIHK